MIHSIINRGVKKYHDEDERRQINLLNMSSAVSITVTTFFLITNLAGHNWELVTSNILLLTFSTSIFFINQLKYYTATIYTLLILLSLYFTANAILFHNNLQYGIFLAMIFTILLVNKKPVRIIMLAFEIAAFITYLLLQNMPSLVAPIPLYKTCIAAFAFLFIFACMLEYFKARLVHYYQNMALANEQLKESNRVKERMLSILSHDFHGPVGNLIKSIDLLEEKLFTPEEFNASSGKLKMQLEVLTTSMKDVLHWGKMQIQGETNEKVHIDIAGTINEVYQLLEASIIEKGIAVNNRVQADITVHGNKEDVKLIFRNLLSNAIKFSNKGGSIFISAERDNGLVKISVIDEGVGINADMLKVLRSEQNNLFSTPGTAKERGTGLGLMLVREFVQKNNGELHIDSQPGKGSIFSVTLPCR